MLHTSRLASKAGLSVCFVISFKKGMSLVISNSIAQYKAIHKGLDSGLDRTSTKAVSARWIYEKLYQCSVYEGLTLVHHIYIVPAEQRPGRAGDSVEWKG